MQRHMQAHVLRRTFTTSQPLQAQKLFLARKLLGVLPQPVKTFGAIMATTAGAMLLAPGLILLVGPPLIVGSWWMFRRLRKVQTELYDRRWRDLASYHLMRDDRAHASTISYDARTRVTDALIANEHGLGALGDPRSEAVTFGPLESLSQDFRGSSSGIAMALKVEQYGLLVNNKRKATVTLVTKDDKARIEVQPKRGKAVVIDGKQESQVIDV